MKRYCKRVRQSDEDDEGLIHRPTTFGDITAADHMFPSQEARGLSDEQSALVVRDMFSGAVMVTLKVNAMNKQTFESLRHFAGRYLSDKNGVLSASDNAKELTGAASKLHFRVFVLITRVGKAGSRCRRLPSEVLAVVGWLHCQSQDILWLVSSSTS